MRTLPAPLAAKLLAGDFTGPNKATTRVTIQKVQLGIYPVATQVFSSIHFLNSTEGARELPNLKSCNWQRTADGDAGSATLELFNTKMLPPGTGPAVGDQFDLLGYYTYNRGRSSYSQSNWGHQANEWQEFLVPDRVLRIYQGYGVDYSVLPEDDPNLLCMGVYIIDDVTYTADGLITVEARDVSRLLYDQIMFPPVVPLVHYPLKFEQERSIPQPKVPEVGTTTWARPVYEGSSNGQIGSSTEVQFGHHPADAFDGSTDPSTGTYWLSRGHSAPRNPDSWEWIQGRLVGADVLSAVKFAVRGGPYRVCLSVWTETSRGGTKTGWLGEALIPYSKGSTTENFSKIPYIVSIVAEFGREKIINFPPITGATKVRLSFTQLYDSKHQPLPFRAAVRDVQVALGPVTLVDQPPLVEGNYADYSNIVKLLLAYGGFYWPQDGTMYLTGSNTQALSFPGADPYLGGAGRVWGDIQMSGTSGPTELGVEIWDKKPLIDGVTYVKDILGFIFFVDETGGAIFRSPNTFKLGNWLTDATDSNAVRTTQYVTILDSEAILGLRSKLTSRNLREHVFVANVDGQVGAVASGRIPYPSSFRRVGGWTDQHFESLEECQVMADLITLRQLFTFRTNSLRIPANPALQVDDQCKIFERTTGDAYFHYVRAINSTWDLTSGKWIYDVTTSWLGETPESDWAIDTSTLSPETQTFLTALGQI